MEREAAIGLCGGCRWWQVANWHGTSGQCRRWAPMATAHGPSWPVTQDDDWCGAHEAADPATD